MRKKNSSSCEPGHKEKHMAPSATATSRALEVQSPSFLPLAESRLSAHAKESAPDFITDREPDEVIKDMNKEDIMNGRIKSVFVLAVTAALFSLAGQSRIFGLSEVVGFAAGIILLSVALGVAVPQLRKNFRVHN